MKIMQSQNIKEIKEIAKELADILDKLDDYISFKGFADLTLAKQKVCLIRTFIACEEQINEM